MPLCSMTTCLAVFVWHRSFGRVRPSLQGEAIQQQADSDNTSKPHKFMGRIRAGGRKLGNYCKSVFSPQS